MLGKEENWIQKHKGFVLGFAVVILVLNVALALLLPSQSSVAFDASGVEYAFADESFSAEHTVRLNGTLTSRSFRPTLFEGTLCVDGAVWALSGEHAADGWELQLLAQNQTSGEAAPVVADVRADREWNTVVLRLAVPASDADFRFISLYAGNRTAAVRSFQEYYEDILHK